MDKKELLKWLDGELEYFSGADFKKAAMGDSWQNGRDCGWYGALAEIKAKYYK